MLDEKNRDEKQTIVCDLRLSRQKFVNFPFNVCEQGGLFKKRLIQTRSAYWKLSSFSVNVKKMKLSPVVLKKM